MRANAAHDFDARNKMILGHVSTLIIGTQFVEMLSRVSYKVQELLTFVTTWIHAQSFGWVRVAHHSVFCVGFYAYLRPVSCVPEVADVFGLSILD